VPIQFDLCESLLRHFGEELNVPVSITRNLYEDVTWRISGNEIRLALGSDLVVTGAAEASTFTPSVDEDGTWLNEYGMRMRQGTIYVEVVEYPLAHVETPSDVVNSIVLPDLSAPGRFDDAASLVNRYRNDYFVVGDMEVTIFTLVQQMVGMEKLMIDMAMGEEYLPRIIEIVTDFHIEHGLRLMDQGVDALWVGDDFGSQTGLLFSREMFRELWKPAYVRMCTAFRKRNPEIALLLHCDGAVSELMDDFIEIGFQVFNPVQPGVPGHGPRELKDGWGERIGFWGAIDQQDLIPRGTDDELARDVKEKITVLGEGGGYVIAPAHILQPDVSPQRVRTFVDLCRRYGSIY
jgi:uroporphyrinogen decarboxylase